MSLFTQIKKYLLSRYAVVIIAILLLTNVVYLVLYITSPKDRHYTGINNYDFADKLVYLSMAKQGSEGLLMMNNLYSSEAQKGLLFSPHWWLIGQSARLISANLSLVMHIYRIILAIIFLIIIYLWLRKLFTEKKHLYRAAVLTLSAGTFGWLLLLFRQLTGQSYMLSHGAWPYDVVATDLTVFSNLQQFPLAILSQSMILGLLYLFVAWSDRWLWSRAIIWGGLLFLFLLIHPYDGLILASVLTIWSYWASQQTKHKSIRAYWLVLLMASLLAAGYFLLSWLVDPVLAGWKSQNVTITPPPIDLLVGLWPYVILAAIGSVVVGRHYRQDPWWRLILIWAWAIWIVAYLPDQFSRRAVNGWIVPLALLSYLGLQAIAKSKMKKMWSGVIVVGLVSIILGSSLYSLVFQFNFFPEIKNNEVFYLSDDLSRLLTVADTAIPKGSIVLASNQKLALMLPAFTGLRSYVGHPHQTIDYERKEKEAEKFWSDAPTAWRKDFLQKNNIKYLIMRRGQFIGSDIDSWLPQLTMPSPVSINSQYALYQVANFAHATSSDQASEPRVN